MPRKTDAAAKRIIDLAKQHGAFEATPGGLKEQIATTMVGQGLATFKGEAIHRLETIHDAKHGRVPLHKVFSGNRAQRRRKAADALAMKRRAKDASKP